MESAGANRGPLQYRTAIFLGKGFKKIARQQRDVFAALAQRRQFKIKNVQAIKEILAQLSFFDGRAGERLVAATTRTDTGMFALPPMRRICPSSSTRKNFGCTSGAISVISSRNRVPPSACSKQPEMAFDGVGESAFLVAEELALHQCRRNRRAV